LEQVQVRADAEVLQRAGDPGRAQVQGPCELFYYILVVIATFIECVFKIF
jgi:hypothetical protein